MTSNLNLALSAAVAASVGVLPLAKGLAAALVCEAKNPVPVAVPDLDLKGDKCPFIAVCLNLSISPS